MKYPIAIEPGSSKTAWGVIVPDLPGCVSAADGGMDEAIELWIEMALDDGKDLPKPSLVTDLQKKKEFKGLIWATVEINPASAPDPILWAPTQNLRPSDS